MKITEENSFRPITIVLEKEAEAKELLGVLQGVVYESHQPEAHQELSRLRATLLQRLGAPISELYTGSIRRRYS